MSGAVSRSTGNSLLRISQACETLLAGFNSGKAMTVKSCLISRQHALSVSERNGLGGELQRGPGEESQPGSTDPLIPLEVAMANRRARPSLLLPAWRAVGFAVGTGATALLPAEASAKVGAAIGRAVTEQYDANIRTMYEAQIEGEESEVKELFKAQRDDPSRAAQEPDAAADGGEDGSLSGAEDADAGADADGGRAMAVAGTLKSALRMACSVTAKI